MSIELIPGIDFGATELVTKDKLSTWVGGVYNLTGNPTASDIGADYPSMSVVATLTTSATEGTLALDSTRGQLCVFTRFGYVPVGLTAGGLFTRRFARGGVATNWYAVRAAAFGANYTVAAVITVSAYSAGALEKGFAATFWRALIGDVTGAVWGGQGCLWPTVDKPWSAVTTSVWTVAESTTPLISFGGWRPVYAQCPSGATFMSSPADDRPRTAAYVAGSTTIRVDTLIKLGRASRLGFVAAEGPTYAYAYCPYGFGMQSSTQSQVGPTVF